MVSGPSAWVMIRSSVRSHLRRSHHVQNANGTVFAAAREQKLKKIVVAILNMARNLGLPAIAESVETYVVLEQLVHKGDEYKQRFYFEKSMSVQSVKEIYFETLQ